MRLEKIGYATLASAFMLLAGTASAQTPDHTPSEAAAADVISTVEPASTIEIPESGSNPLPAEAEEAGDTQRFDDVVVTSTKREKSLRDIPQSISSFNGDDLETQGKVDLADYIEQSPGVVMNTTAPNLVRITIRGIGVETSSLSPQPSPTGIFINDTAFTDPYINGVQPDLSAFDLSSVELLKGPQGTLFGGSALAGAVRYILKEPTLGQWEAKGFTQMVSPKYGESAFTSGVTVNAPIYKDRLAVRLGYVNRNYPGVTDDTRPPTQENVDSGAGEQIRALATWQPLDELTFKLVHLSQDYEAPNQTTVSLDGETRETDHLILPQPVNNDFTLDTLSAEYQFETMKAVSLTSRTKKHLLILADGTPSLIGKPPAGYPAALGAILGIKDDAEATAQEFRLQSTGEGAFQWLAGAYFYDYKVHFETLADLVAHQALLGDGSLLAQLQRGLTVDPTFLANETSLLLAVADVKATERALFFDLSYTLWDDLELTAGARVYETEVKGGFTGVGVIARSQNNGQNIDYADNSIKESGVSPKFSALYHASKNISLYAQAARGFRFGGLQSVPSTPGNDVPASYKSDSLWNYELGSRTQWFDNTLRVDLTAFYIDYKNPQIVQATTGVLPLNYTDNVGGAISQGLEASIRWLTPISGLSLQLDGGVTDAHTTEEFETSDGTVVAPGAQMPGSAKTSYGAGLAYLRPIGDILLGTSLDYAYIGKGYSSLVGGPDRAINDYGTLNVGLSIGSEVWPLRPTLALNVSNVLDEVGAKTREPRNRTTQIEPYTLYLLNPPRTFTARLSLSF